MPHGPRALPLDVFWIPVVPGRLGVCRAPGQNTHHGAAAADYYRDLGEDVRTLRDAHGAALLVCLLEDHELAGLGILELPSVAAAYGLPLLRMPVRDGAVPHLGETRSVVARVVSQLDAGGAALVFCRAGLGRSGILASCVLVDRGLEPDDAIRLVRRHRSPRAVETAAQEAFVHAFARAVRSG